MTAPTNSTAEWDERAADDIVERLAVHGYAMADGLLPPALVATLLAELKDGALSDAGVGREQGHRLDGKLRRASIRWFEGGTAAERDFLAFAEALRVRINRGLFLGLFDFECHFLAYPVGGFYGRHLDSLQGARNRVVSMVAYLDPRWTEADGGQLRLWSGPQETDAPAAEILPQPGRIVLMLSETIPHEVLPAHRPRHAIAGWWRVNASVLPA